jgi:GntR family transcriptional regulator, negative regulator for fad regulon and positive regulator of fabA
MKRTHEMVEKALVEGLLKGEPKPGSHLESERELAARFTVSRATVREALVKLQKSGWISVQQRRATVVNDFWCQGDFELLSSITKNSDPFPYDLATHLLELRIQFAPHYARRAVEKDAAEVAECLNRSHKLRNSAGTIAKFDAHLHLTMAVLSGNKLYPLVMNSFADVYARVKGQFFTHPEHRTQALTFYRDLLDAAEKRNADAAETITREAMKLRLQNFVQLQNQKG